MSKVNLNVLIIFSAWMAFQVFSLISINHIGVGIWFWIFSGALVNIYLTSENSNLSPQPIGAYRFRILSSILLVLVFVSPIFRESISFERIRKSENLSVLINYYENHQLFSNNLLYVSYKLKTLGYDTSSLEANRILINKFPNFYDGWNLLIFQNEAREDEKVLAREQLLRLDPLNSGK